MGNISTNLLRFNGEIGPQYLDPDDKTGGPDGTMKPITKDVLREMIMLNLPEIQKVQDEYVKAELESIKQTQQQILQRLNQPINTQLTGSNTEYVFLEYVELTAGSTVYTEAQDYNGSRLGVNVRFNNAIKHRVRGFLLSKQAGRGVGGVVDIIDSRNTAATQTRGSLQMTTTRVNIGITNDDVIDTQVNLVSIVDFII